MNVQGRSSAWWLGVPLMLALAPQPAGAISLTLRDLIDPVPPGGTLTYTIRVNAEGGTGSGGVYCFNPPPECTTSPGTCSKSAPQCVGNSFIGYVCANAANDGTDCGVGDPPIPDLTLCVPVTGGTCTGGMNAGLPCTTNADCPGNTCVCVHAYNEGDFCCTGNPPQVDSSLCLANPTGICSGGPSLGQPCSAPHGQATEECPDDGGGSTDIAVRLPNPPEATFVDGTIEFAGAGNTVTGDATGVTFTLPPLDPCGVSGTPQCPLLTANLLVNPLTPVGTIITSQATAGSVASGTSKTTVGTFALKQAILGYTKRIGKDRFVYRAVFTLGPGATIDPQNESFRVQLNTPATSIIDLALEPGQLLPFSTTTHQFKSRESGLNRVKLRQLAPSHYSLNLRASRMSLPVLDDLNVTIALTFGDDNLSQPLTFLVKRAGLKFVALK